MAARCSAVNKLGMASPAEASSVFCRNLLLEVMLLVNRLLDIELWVSGYGIVSYWVKLTADSPL
ncbi:MAG TPA: hypothetical protein VK014_04295 [Cyclobacteriaceae bacterium]|nr:hypothetical protein [Cyclobacteriaceae bacterium]